MLFSRRTTVSLIFADCKSKGEKSGKFEIQGGNRRAVEVRRDLPRMKALRLDLHADHELGGFRGLSPPYSEAINRALRHGSGLAWTL